MWESWNVKKCKIICKMNEICTKLIKKTTKRRWRQMVRYLCFKPWTFFSSCSSFSIVDFKHTGWSKKSALFCFSSQSCVLQFFPYFSGGVNSRPGRFFWHQYGTNWTIFYAEAHKNHWGVLCRKINSSDTTATQERFCQEQCTW